MGLGYRTWSHMERTRLCGLILRENFGNAVEQIGVYLMKNGARPLHSIIRDCKYDRATVSSQFIPRVHTSIYLLWTLVYTFHRIFYARNCFRMERLMVFISSFLLCAVILFCLEIIFIYFPCHACIVLWLYSRMCPRYLYVCVCFEHQLAMMGFSLSHQFL